MNESLLHLYELQRIDSKLDDLIEGRGELPNVVTEMRSSVERTQIELERLRTHTKQLEQESRRLTEETRELRETVDRYKSQQFDVKTTREYDSLTHQLDDSQRRLTKGIDDTARIGIELEQSKIEIGQLEQQYENITADLEQAESTLEMLMEETKGEEERLLARREEVIKKVNPQHLSIYHRVRPAKNGIAVVAVRNGVCGGCFNAMPRQLVLELKRGEKHSVCEYCGRVVVGEPIAIAIDGEPQPVDIENQEGEE